MVTRENRLRDFNTSVAAEGMRATLLCEDHAGTYLFAVRLLLAKRCLVQGR
jgi:hypothetical protein